MLSTSFTKLVGCTVPVQLAPRAAEGFRVEVTGEVAFAGTKMAVPRLSVIAPTADTTGAIEAMALYAGESVANVTRVQPAAEIVKEICEGAVRLLTSARA